MPVGESGDRTVLVNVTPAMPLALRGATERVDAVLAGILTALRILPWADELAVELLGLPVPPLDEHAYNINPTTPELLGDLTNRRAIERHRIAGVWRRETLVVTSPAADRLLGRGLRDRLAETVGLIGATGPAFHVLAVGDKGARLEPYGLVLAPVAPNSTQRSLADSMLAAMSASARSEPNETPADSARKPGVVDVVVMRPRPILGERNSLRGPDADRVLELLAYLSLHGGSSPPRAIVQALELREGPGVVERRLDDLWRATRIVLGPSFGRDVVGIDPTGEWQLDTLVTSDWKRFRAAIRMARAADARDAIELLQRALELAEGPPDPATCYPWLVGEGFVEAMVADVVDAAHHLASLALATGDVALARRAIEQGRRFEPASEMLVRDLLIALESEGRIDELGAAYEEFCATLAALGALEPSEATRALARELRA
jgi:hypothetical protein